MRWAFYVSDHGFGHATRTIALLRSALEQDPALSVLVATGPGAGGLLRRSFRGEPRIGVRVSGSDPGMVLSPGTLRVDPAGTAGSWRRWVDAWDRWVEEERAALGEVGAVLADGTPPALLLARKLRVPGILLGNFAWSDVLAEHLPAGLIDVIRRTLSLADASFAYPFALPFDGAPAPRPLPLVARRARRSRGRIRDLLGVGADEPLVYLSAGRSSNPESLWAAARGCGARALLPDSAPEIPGTVRIPAGEPEGQDYLAACDLVAGKIGYGTLSEALVAGVPVVMVLVDGTVETGPLREGMHRSGAGEAICEGEDLRPAIRRWLGTGGGSSRPYAAEDTDGAARALLEGVSAVIASSP